MTKKKTPVNDHGQHRSLFFISLDGSFQFLEGKQNEETKIWSYKYAGAWLTFKALKNRGFIRFPMRRFVRLTSTSDQKIGTHVQLPFYAAQQKAWYGGGWMGLRELRMVHKLADAPEIKQLPGKGASEFYKDVPMGAQIQRPKRRR